MPTEYCFFSKCLRVFNNFQEFLHPTYFCLLAKYYKFTFKKEVLQNRNSHSLCAGKYKLRASHPNLNVEVRGSSEVEYYQKILYSSFEEHRLPITYITPIFLPGRVGIWKWCSGWYLLRPWIWYSWFCCCSGTLIRNSSSSSCSFFCLSQLGRDALLALIFKFVNILKEHLNIETVPC